MTSPTPSEPRTGQQLYHAAPLTPVAAAKVAAAAILTIYVLQIGLKAVGVPDLLASTIGNTAVIAGLLFYMKSRKLGLADAGVRRTRARFLVAAALVGVSTWYLTLWLVYLLQPPGDTAKLQGLVEQLPLVPTLVALTIFPAVAEELVFRGVLLRALQPRFGNALAIVITAAVFGLYHLNPPQILSTFALGLALGFLTVRAGSIVPAVIVHMLNNTIAILLSRDEVPGAAAWVSANPAPMLAGSALLVTGGIVIAARGAA